MGTKRLVRRAQPKRKLLFFLEGGESKRTENYFLSLKYMVLQAFLWVKRRDFQAPETADSAPPGSLLTRLIE
jgi:hypothetical protein